MICRQFLYPKVTFTILLTFYILQNCYYLGRLLLPYFLVNVTQSFLLANTNFCSVTQRHEKLLSPRNVLL